MQEREILVTTLWDHIWDKNYIREALKEICLYNFLEMNDTMSSFPWEFLHDD